MSWDPKGHKPDREQGSYDDRVVPSGNYLLGATWWSRLSERAIKLRLEVLAGPFKGASVFPIIATNVDEKRPSADRMYFFCRGFDITGSLDFSDNCISEEFVGVAGKANLQKEQNGQYTNHNLRKVYDRDELSKEEAVILQKWVEGYKTRDRGDSTDPGADSFDPDDYSDDDVSFPKDDFGDDDIPF